MQYIRRAQTLKYYGYIQFDPCITDFPEKGCKVIVSAGNKELNFRVQLPNEQVKEGSFKVTRMRCWRVTSCVSLTLKGIIYTWWGGGKEGVGSGSFTLLNFLYISGVIEWVRAVVYKS